MKWKNTDEGIGCLLIALSFFIIMRGCAELAKIAKEPSSQTVELNK